MNSNPKRWAALLGALAIAMAPPKAATISVSPTSLSINAPLGGPNPAPSTLTLQNTGSGKLNWTAVPSAPWLFVSPGSGVLHPSESIDLSVTVNVVGLGVGSYPGTIKISDPAASNSPQVATISLQVNAVPDLEVKPGSLSFAAPAGGPNPAGQSVTAQNSGGGTLSWTATVSAPWLSGSPSSGTLSAGASQTVTVLVNVAGLAAGTYAGTLTLAAPGALNSPQSVGVNLVVSQSALIGISPATLTFDGPQGGANPASQGVQLSNSGGGTLTWTAAPSAAWLSVTPSSGSLGAGRSQTLTISVNTASLAGGTYMASVTVTAAGVSNSPQSVAVTLNVNAVPKIGASPLSLSFTAATDTGNNFPSALSVTNTGSGTLAWSASGGAAWLSIQPTSGTLGALASEPLLLSVSAAGMTPGDYTTTFQISDPNAANSPVTLAVDLTVTPSSLPVHAKAGACGALGMEGLGVLLGLWTSLGLLRRKGGGTCFRRSQG
jgi:hypothetical protein